MSEEFEAIELEYSEDDILYYIVDEDDNEIGFALLEEGEEVEYYYEGFDACEYETVLDASQPSRAAAPLHEDCGAKKENDPEEHGYLYKMATIAGFEGNKARKIAEDKLDVVRGKAETHVEKASAVAKDKAREIKGKTDELDIGITRKDVAETTADLNAIAKEGAETAKELKEAYDDIMDSFGFLVPKKMRRRLP